MPAPSGIKAGSMMPPLAVTKAVPPYVALDACEGNGSTQPNSGVSATASMVVVRQQACQAQQQATYLHGQRGHNLLPVVALDLLCNSAGGSAPLKEHDVTWLGPSGWDQGAHLHR